MSDTSSAAFPSHEGSLSRGARLVLRQRYLARDRKGRVVETPAHMFRRIAADVALAERRYPAGDRLPRSASRFSHLMASLDFLPNSPTLMNAGRSLQQLSACFVLPVEDSLSAILESVRDQALIHQSGGGTGFSFSRLRPHDDLVASTSGVASGPISFMRIFNLTTDVIKQGGMRRGANMGVLRVDHPDILDFIELKNNPREMTNFNLSVGLTDAFMETRRRNGRYALLNPRTGRPVRRLPARLVFDRLVAAAWTAGEPGVLYLDTINRANPVAHLGEIEATNPCGEQPLLPYESCTLGSINVARYLLRRNGRAEIDYARLAETIPLAVRFLDNVLDRNRYPLPDIEAATLRTRKIGLGIMGFADLLIALEIPYDTEEALRTASRLMAFVQSHAHEASRRLADERGPFPAYPGSGLAQRRDPRRHATVTTIAPTGTISIIAGCSPGIEPLYAVRTVRTIMDGTRLITLHPAFRRMARAAGLDMDRLVPRLSEEPSIRHYSTIPSHLRRLFVTAHDIDPAHHVRMQAIFQHYSDSGVSKTINLPATATQAQVADAFLLAYRLGCKGLTVFRTGSRAEQVLSCAVSQTC
ncbi:MAG: adenosylcobalamin-dependent ribonucleoside-diphosphate reductase [Nitrospira sp.]|nr:adenosylcobalamin-dependent ribonucleoside-diphosphate reductase [Nitrospira sp.]